MNEVTLTPHQQGALDWIVAKLIDGAPLIALRGFAGSGKTTLIKPLRAALAALDKTALVGSPTHRAAMILRQKGIQDADTLHSHALMPYFTPDYKRAAAWLGEEVQARSDAEAPKPDVEGLPWLVHETVQPQLEWGRDLLRLRGKHKAKRLLSSIGISGKEHFAGFGAKTGQGLLIIDEASMVGRDLLTICQQAFRQILLVGDPGQLPPVKDEAMLSEVEGIDLTEVHRQAQDSPILQLATRARQGEPFWQDALTADALARGDAIQVVSHTDAARLRTAPLLVWRNSTRIACTHVIRTALGYSKERLEVGEPLVCRSTSQEDRVLGFYNNGLYTVVAVDPDHPRRVTLEDAMGDLETVIVHMEEADGKQVSPEAIPFRWGYVLTAHTAQGGEWPLVHLSLPELWLYAGVQGKRGRQEDVAQWTYTAITRAKQTLCFMTQHQFFTNGEAFLMAAPRRSTTEATFAPPADPLFVSETDPLASPAPVEEASSPVPMLGDEDDDIADPAVPDTLVEALHVPQDATARPGKADMPPDIPPVSKELETALQARARREQPRPATLPEKLQDHEALLHAFMTHLLQRLNAELFADSQEIMKTVGAVIQLVEHTAQHVGQQNEHAQYTLGDALTKLQTDGLALRHEPYQASVQAVSPQGYPITIQVAKAEAADLVQALPALTAWLVGEGYTAPVVPSAERAY